MNERPDDGACLNSQMDAHHPLDPGDDGQYRLLFERNPNPMMVFEVSSFRFLAVNEAAVRKYGYSREEFLGMVVPALHPPTDVLEGVDVKSTLPVSIPTRHSTKSGAVIDVDIESELLIFDGVPARLVMATDTTDRRRAEAAALEGARRYKDLFENVPVGLYLTSADGVGLDVNRAFFQMMGYDSCEEMLAAGPDTFYVDPAERTRWRQEMERTGEVRDFEMQMRRRSGEIIWVRHTASTRYDREGTALYYEGAIQDITEHRRLEAQLLQASKMEAIGQLAGGVAHDFNNILTAIQGQALLVLDESDLTASVRQDVSEIEANARRAADLTRQLLAFSRQQILQARVVDLSHVVDGLFPMLRRLIGSHVTVSSEARPDLWNVCVDPNQIERIILNLAVNAEQAMPSGGTLKISLRNTELDASYGSRLGYEVKPGDYVSLSVSDTGVGMDDATLSRIFEPFFTTKLQGRGTGLGLSTVYGVVKQSGGYIWVESTLGTGTTFRIYLPAVSESVTKISRPSVSIDRDTGRSETIMVCEDEAPVRALVKRVLEKSGYRVLSAADPREALSIARTLDAEIHLLLTDIVMPEMGGRELARQVRLVRPGIRVVLMSGYSDADLTLNADPSDVTPFLQKPFTPTNLTRIVGATLAPVNPTRAAMRS